MKINAFHAQLMSNEDLGADALVLLDAETKVSNEKPYVIAYDEAGDNRYVFRRDDFKAALEEEIITHDDKAETYTVPSHETRRLDSGLILFNKLIAGSWSVDAIK